MENVSRALLMAGGALISVLILLLLMYVYRQYEGLQITNQNQQYIEETSKFNQKFLAYNKLSMYGSDVISAINMAIDNNSRYESRNDKIQNQVDIVLTINQDLVVNKITMKWNNEKNKWEQTAASVYGKDTISSGKYELFKETDKSVFDNIRNEESKVIKENARQKEIVETHFSNFEKMMFSCTGVEYDGVTGRVNKLTFEQIYFDEN